MRARVTLRGLVVEREPGRVEVVPWSTVESHGQGMFVEVGPDGEKVGGWRDVLRLKDTREGRVAARLHERAMRRAFRDGTLEIERSFRSEIKGQRVNSIFVGCLLLTLVWMVMFQLGGPWYGRAGLLVLTLSPAFAMWWMAVRALPYRGSRGVLRVRLTPYMLGIERRDGTREEYSFDDARRLELSGVPLIELRNGEIVRVPGLRGIRGVLKMVQRERFPDAAEREKGSLHRSLVRSCGYFMIGGVVAGVMTWYLQGQGLIPPSRLRPWGAALLLGLGMPAMLILVAAFQAWMNTGVPPWKKKAWFEMFQ